MKSFFALLFSIIPEEKEYLLHLNTSESKHFCKIASGIEKSTFRGVAVKNIIQAAAILFQLESNLKLVSPSFLLKFVVFIVSSNTGTNNDIVECVLQLLWTLCHNASFALFLTLEPNLGYCLLSMLKSMQRSGWQNSTPTATSQAADSILLLLGFKG